MTDINTVTLSGHVTHDLTDRDFAYTPGGTAKASFSVAVNASVKKADGWEEKVSYIDIVVWGKQAEYLRQYLTKGKQVFIEGTLEQDRWQDKQTGVNRSKVYVKARNVQLAKTAQASGIQSQWAGQAAPQVAGNIGNNTGEFAEFADDYPPF